MTQLILENQIQHPAHRPLSAHEKPAASIETGKRTKELKILEANSNPRPRVGGF